MTYSEVDLVDIIDRMVTEAGWQDPLSPDQLDRLDQFHVGGMDAVDTLISSLGVRTGDKVLDIGSGLGGPARRVAQKTGAAVHGVDVTQSYVEAAQFLTGRSDLGPLVSFEQVDIAALGTSTPYDAAITIHVQMNVEDKVSFFGAIRANLRPGGRLALWEICSTGENDPVWPMPWSMDGTDSYLTTGDGLRQAAIDTGFEVLEWSDETQWATDWFASTFKDGPPPGPALPKLLNDGFTRVLNLAGALGDGTVSIVRGVLAKSVSELGVAHQ
jgi:ubiquinone/menaquinone biosynthesis C-methylase UbiE